MPDANWRLEPDLKHVTVTFPINPSVQLRLGLAAIEELLLRLGEFRAAMVPEVAPAYALLGQKVSAVPNPAWATAPEAMQGDSLLHLRDPRYGWLHYMLPRHEAQQLGQLLQTQAANPPVTPPPGKTN